MDVALVKIQTFIPEEYVKSLRDELNNIGALTIDDVYDYCMAVSKVIMYVLTISSAIVSVKPIKFIIAYYRTSC